MLLACTLLEHTPWQGAPLKVTVFVGGNPKHKVGKKSLLLRLASPESVESVDGAKHEKGDP